MIYTVRTTVGRENAVIETLIRKIKSRTLNIKTIFHPGELKGYIFVEGEEEEIDNVIKAVPHIKGLIRREVKIDDIKKFLEVKKIEIKIFYPIICISYSYNNYNIDFYEGIPMDYDTVFYDLLSNAVFFWN